MAFRNANLSVISFCGGFTLWQYKTQDPIEDIDGKNYFGPIWTLAACGDVIYITAQGRTYQRQIIEIAKDKIIVGKLD